MAKKIIIIGASEHGRVVADIIEKENKYKLLGFIDAQKTKKVNLWKYSILGNEEDIPAILHKEKNTYLVIAIGDNWVRKTVSEKLKVILPNAKYGKCVHPSASIGKKVKIGEGTVVMAGAIINPNTKIGDHCIINTKTSIDHDCTIGNFSSLALNVTTGGSVTIGNFTAIGLSASIIHGKTIGDHTLIGASSLVITNFKNNVIAFGVPAKPIKKREIGDKYL